MFFSGGVDGGFEGFEFVGDVELGAVGGDTRGDGFGDVTRGVSGDVTARDVNKARNAALGGHISHVHGAVKVDVDRFGGVRRKVSEASDVDDCVE